MLGLFNIFNLLKKKDRDSNHQDLPELFDLDNEPLKDGDIVESLRYDLGTCQVVLEENTYYYESIGSGERVSWVRMIDAATEMQKVRKVQEE